MMSNTYSVDDLLGFLEHAADKGLMPPATATALAVACRNVLAPLGDEEKADVRRLDLDTVAKRFHNKRARDFSGDTLKEYDRRVRRAVALFVAWRDDPANFKARTRTSSTSRKRKTQTAPEVEHDQAPLINTMQQPSAAPGTFQTALPLGRDRVVTLQNVPVDLTTAEAERLAAFVRMLAVEAGA